MNWDFHLTSFALFDSWVRYAVLYTGIAVDMILPILGHKRLAKLPTNTAHLLERFALLTLILFGESVVSILAVIQPQKGTGIPFYFRLFHLS